MIACVVQVYPENIQTYSQEHTDKNKQSNNFVIQFVQ